MGDKHASASDPNTSETTKATTPTTAANPPGTSTHTTPTTDQASTGTPKPPELDPQTALGGTGTPNATTPVTPKHEAEEKPLRRFWTIATFLLTSTLLFSQFHEASEWIIAVDQRLLDGLRDVDTWSLMEAYTREYGTHEVQARDIENYGGLLLLCWYFVPVTLSVAGRAMSQGVLPFLWVAGSIMLACVIAFRWQIIGDNHGDGWNWGGFIRLPLAVLFILLLQSLVATLFVFLLIGGLTAIGIVVQKIGLVALPTYIVSRLGLEQVHSVMSFVESSKEMRELIGLSAKKK